MLELITLRDPTCFDRLPIRFDASTPVQSAFAFHSFILGGQILAGLFPLRYRRKCIRLAHDCRANRTVREQRIFL